jgi:hypothetical protein
MCKLQAPLENVVFYSRSTFAESTMFQLGPYYNRVSQGEILHQSEVTPPDGIPIAGLDKAGHDVL